jgi:hypothetical protein
MIKQLKASTALLFAAGTLAFVGAAPAHAGTCPGDGTNNGTFNLSLIDTDPSLTCTIGDKTYSNFSYTGFVTTVPANNVVTISESGMGGLQHTIGMMNTTGWTSASNTFNYTVSIASGPNTFDLWAATGSSSIIMSGFDSTVTATNSTPSPNPNMVSGAFSTAMSPSTFTNGTTTSAFTNTFNVTNNAFTSFDNSIVQKSPPTGSVPGPLPLLGAGAAFGFSRRIRSRIKAAA